MRRENSIPEGSRGGRIGDKDAECVWDSLAVQVAVGETERMGGVAQVLLWIEGKPCVHSVWCILSTAECRRGC